MESKEYMVYLITSVNQDGEYLPEKNRLELLLVNERIESRLSDIERVLMSYVLEEEVFDLIAPSDIIDLLDTTLFELGKELILAFVSFTATLALNITISTHKLKKCLDFTIEDLLRVQNPEYLVIAQYHKLLKVVYGDTSVITFYKTMIMHCFQKARKFLQSSSS